jgi:hypothetical protein
LDRLREVRGNTDITRGNPPLDRPAATKEEITNAINKAIAAQPAPDRSETITLSVTNVPRPMLELIERLQARLGFPISYEEPQWVHPDDSVRTKDIPVNHLLAQGMSPEKIADIRPEAIGPALGSLEVRFDVNPKTGVPTGNLNKFVTTLFDTAFNSHSEHHNPGEFKTLDLGIDGVTVVPSAVRNKEGTLESAQSPLDAVISFPEEERSVQETLRLVGDRIASATGQNLFVNDAGFPTGQVVRVGAKAEIARDILARILRDTHPLSPRVSQPVPRRAWRMTYSVENGTYYLRFVALQKEQADGTRTTLYWAARQDSAK